MKIMILLFLMITLLYSFSNSQTTVPGGNVSGTWTLSASPYLIQGSIMIPNDSTLTIEPGVTVDFQGSYKMYVQGKVIAIGAISDTIYFTTSNISIGWRGIRYDNTPATNDSSIFSYCKLQYCIATGTGAELSGGAFYFLNFSKVLISNCRIANNTANSGGGFYCNASNPIISNCTIFNCSADFFGGGISCQSASPLITNNEIINNSALVGGGIYCSFDSNPNITYNNISNNIINPVQNFHGGGGIYCYYSSPIITYNTISNNTSHSQSDGGGIACRESNPVISNNSITNNTAHSGGGINCYSNSSPIISDNFISGNSTSGTGGGIDCSSYCNPNITHNTITNNVANSCGGGIYCYSSNPKIILNTITYNSTSDGGGIYCINSSSSKISNNIISKNYASSYGGGIYMNYCNSVFNNNTISFNSAANGGGLYCHNSSCPIFKNTILWGNTASLIGPQVYLNDEPSDPKFYYCNVQGGSLDFGLNGIFFTGIYSNNINSDPMFVDPLTDDCSLQFGSPCIDSGTPDTTGLLINILDIADSARISGDSCIIDIGAYENQNGICPSNGLEDIRSRIYINIFPIPAANEIKIETSQKSEIEITNIEGQVLKKLNNAETNFTIDIKNLPRGIYIIKANTNKEIVTKKFIKE